MTMPNHVLVDLSRFMDVIQFFRCPLVMGPGNSDQWALDENFDFLCADLTRHMQNRGVTVLPIDHWIDAYDRDADKWHAGQNTHNMVQMTLQFTHAVNFRNQCAISQSLPSQAYPFRDPLRLPAKDHRGFEVAE